MDNNNKDITLKVSNHIDLKRTRPADIGNNKENIRLADINEQRPATSNWAPQNKLLSKSSLTFREITFIKSKFQAGTPVSNT